MFSFTPEEHKAVKVPYYDDVSREQGWQGYTTGKSVETLQAEIVKAFARLGGIVSGFQRGAFQIDQQTREGFRVHYSIQSPNGFIPGRLDVAALPVRSKYDEKKKDKTLRMALYMLRTSLEGMWFIQQLSPGYAPLMPWMLAEGDKTITQLWAETSIMNRLLPPAESEFVEGEIVS